MADRDDAIAAYREFTRALIVRFERTVHELVKGSRAERELILAEIRANHRQAMAEIEDHRAETRAHTQALFRLLDRLDGGAEPAT